ncbi:MAG: DNA-3-methyladenine glycosylase I [Gammaproteobacteria bacterium]|nr:DNA-3-methyladenine glycosylase I [Gammaproteobacteria bacterium]PCH64474.1 MAG: DNA-3-methyladenine glycosylase I [Gammaproteobacteria bacterium]
MSNKSTAKRCAWAEGKAPYYLAYHDDEWGKPINDDTEHFELLCLEGAQAGLSWDTVLKKRERYRKVFHQFDIARCARLTDAYLEKLLHDPGIIRNRLKVYSVRSNAIAFQTMQAEHGSFNTFIWNLVDNTPRVNRWRNISDVPATSELSEQLSKQLKKRGFKFVGSTIVYAYLQAAGLIIDHTTDCDWHPDNQ